MQLAKQRLQALQEELGAIEETTEEMNQIMVHVDGLQRHPWQDKEISARYFHPRFFS
jgi:hypothetical protein